MPHETHRLTDAHIHASQFPNAGIFGKSTLLDWLDTYTFPLESSLASLPRAHTVYSQCIRRTLAHGTTTAAYYATVSAESTNLLADLCHGAGQRAFIGRCNMDNGDMCPAYYRDASASRALADTEATIAHIARLDPTNDLLTPILTPRFALSCTMPLMRGLGDIHKRTNLPIQTHISENTAEIEAVLAQFPEHGSYAAIYDAAGLLTPRTVLAHGVHLTEEEIHLIQRKGTSIAHCPASNTCLGSGICGVRELLDAGVPVGLGTDMSGGYTPSVLAACREAGALSRLRTAPGFNTATPSPSGCRAQLDRLKLSVEETLHLATRGGARCLGLQDRVAGFAVGMAWDAQFVDLGPEVLWDREPVGATSSVTAPADCGNVQIYPGMSWPDRLAKWVFCGDERNTRAVWVQGRLVAGGMQHSQ